MVDVGSAKASLILDTSGFSKNLQSAQSQLNQAQNNMGNVGASITKVGDKMTAVGKTMTTAVTLPVAALGTAVVKTGVDFEKQMSRVQAISGASGDSFEKLQKKAREMGESTIYSATESAEAFEYMALAGWKDEQMLRGIEPILKLAGAAQMDLGTASDIVTDNLTAFGLTADDASRFVDVMAATMANSNTDVTMLGESFKYVAPMAGQLGYSIEDVSLALGTMANSGIKASQGGTSLRRMLINMVSPTKKVQAAMDELGVSLFDSEGNARPLRSVLNDLRGSLSSGTGDVVAFKSGVANLSEQLEQGLITEQEYDIALQELVKSTGMVTDEFKLQSLAALAGATGMSGLAAVVGSSSEEWDKLAGAIDNSQGAATTMYDTMTDNLWGSFQELKSMLQEVALQLSEILIPIVKEVVGWIKEWVEKFKGLDEWQKVLIVKIAGFAAALGPILLIGGKLTSGIGNIISLGAKLIPTIGGASGAISGLGTATSAVGGIVSKFTSVGLGGLTSILSKVGTSIMAVVSTLGGPLTAAILAAIAIIVLLVANWDKVKEVVSKVGKAISEWASNASKAIKNWANNTMTSIKEWGNNFTQKVSNAFKNAKNALSNWADSMISGVKGIASNVITTISNNFGNIPSIIGNAFFNAFNTIVSWGRAIIDQAAAIGSNVLNTIINFFNQIPNKLGEFFNNAVNIGQNIVRGIAQGISGAFGYVTGAIQSIGSNIVNGFKNFFGIHSPSTLMKEKIGIFLPPGISEGFVSAMPKAAKDMQKSLDENVEKLEVEDIEIKPEIEVQGEVTDFSTSLKNIYDDLLSWFVDVDEKISNSIESMTKNLINLIDLSKEIVMPNIVVEDGFGTFSSIKGLEREEPYNRMGTQPSTITNNFTFNTDEPIDEIEASRLLKQTAQDIADGFIF